MCVLVLVVVLGDVSLFVKYSVRNIFFRGVWLVFEGFELEVYILEVFLFWWFFC